MLLRIAYALKSTPISKASLRYLAAVPMDIWASPCPQLTTKPARESPFIAPITPGIQPAPAAGATAAQITEATRLHKIDEKIFEEYTAVVNVTKQKLLTAVDNIFLEELADATFGYVDVSITAMLTHLLDRAELTNDDIQHNIDTLSEPWNIDEPIEVVWNRIRLAQQFAALPRVNEPLTDRNVLHSTIKVFEATGIFTEALDTWRRRPTADQTLVNLKLFFAAENAERLRKFSAQAAGFHGANAAISSGIPTVPPERNSASGAIRTDNGIVMYYCHTHGLGLNRAHTSLSCRNKGPNHHDAATADNMMGGNNTINRGPRRRDAATNGPDE
jgi:hypothetical protein